jgi:NADPH:quinone reductase-like Zn-dependent oxidoreductase
VKAAVVKAWGESPEYTDFADPAPADGAEVATVEASALTNLTRGLMSGKHYASKEIQLPAIAGVDGVARLADGRRVYTGAVAPYGMIAERTLVNPHGAVEHVQLARTVFGAGRVVVAGRNVSRLDWLRTVGADDAIALDESNLGDQVAAQHTDRPFDAVLDYLWGEPAEQVLTALASSHPAAHYHATRLVQIGSMAACHSRCWHDCAPKRCRDCSRWSLPANCNYIQRHVRSPTSARSGPRPSPRAPEWC